MRALLQLRPVKALQLFIKLSVSLLVVTGTLLQTQFHRSNSLTLRVETPPARTSPPAREMREFLLDSTP
jgi:hypothetical protein